MNNQPPEFLTRYRRAFADYGAQALWNIRAFETPTQEDALVVARALRVEGNMRARVLAEEIERASVPLSKIQTEVLHILASRRDPEISAAMLERYNKSSNLKNGERQ